MDKLKIDQKQSDLLYNAAGEEVDDPPMSLSLESLKGLLSDKVHLALTEVLNEVQLGFQLQDFQLLAIHVIGSSRNLVLVAPTGSGKMLVIYMGILVLRKILQNPRGVAIGTQPLSLIMEEKLDLNSGPVKVGVIKMDGQTQTAEDRDEGAMPVKLSHHLEKFTSGELAVLMGHPESWNSPIGKKIIKMLKEKSAFLLCFIDEFHQGLSQHWDVIRPEMKTVPSSMQIHKSPGAPTVVMSATATDGNIVEMTKHSGLKDPVILKENPVQSHFKFQVIERPPTLYQTSGKWDSNGQFHPGLESLLNRLYLDEYVRNPTQAKKAIFFFRDENKLVDINDILCERLPNYSDPFLQPWVQCHGGTGEVTESVNYGRRDEITLWLTTNKMMMGIDLKGIQVVVFIRPPNLLHYVLQGAGRGGRKTKSCKRNRVLVYLLFNKSDIGDNVPGMSKEMKEFLQTTRCLKMELSNFFGFKYECKDSL